MSNNESQTEEGAHGVVLLAVSRPPPPTISAPAHLAAYEGTPPTASQTALPTVPEGLPAAIPEAAPPGPSEDHIALCIPEEYPPDLPGHVDEYIRDVYRLLNGRVTFPEKLAIVESDLDDVMKDDKPFSETDSVHFRYVLMELMVAISGVTERLRTLLDTLDGILKDINEPSARALLDDTVEEFRHNVLLDGETWKALWRKFSDKDHLVGTEAWENFKRSHERWVKEGMRKQEEYYRRKAQRE